MTRVLLVNSPSHLPGIGAHKAGRWIPGEQLGLGYLASVLRNEGHSVEIWDAFMLGLSVRVVADRILEREVEFDLVGLSVSDGKIEGCAQCLELLAALPQRIHLTLGGHSATLCHKEWLQQYLRLDSVIRGEGEIPVVALCDALSGDKHWKDTPGLSYRQLDGSVYANPMPEFYKNLDDIPFPARDTLAHCIEQGFAVSIDTSRGCMGGCTFCATRLMYQPAMGRSWRSRSVDHILAEVELLINQYGIRRIGFEDEDFFGFGSSDGFDRAEKLACEILLRGLKFEFAILTRADNVNRELLALLKKAGLRYVFLGAESGSQRSLDFYNKETTVDQNIRAVKILQELDIDHEILWIMYGPETSLEDIEANIQFLKHVDSLNINLLNKLKVYHGTTMHAQLKREKRLRGNFLEYDYDFQDPRVTLFEKEAQAGLSAFYQVINHADALKWQIGETHPLKQAVSLIANRLHLSAVEWLQELFFAVKQQADCSSLREKAVQSVTESAHMLARLVTAWPVKSTPLSEKALT